MHLNSLRLCHDLGGSCVTLVQQISPHCHTRESDEEPAVKILTLGQRVSERLLFCKLFLLKGSTVSIS